MLHISHPGVSSRRPGLEDTSRSRQDCVKEAVGKDGAEQRDVVVEDAELGLWDVVMRLTDEDCPPSAGS